jgi:hypothetical protein
MGEIMYEQLLNINRNAHKQTQHPMSLDWPEVLSEDEKRYCSRFVFGDDAHGAEALTYIAKELAQLSEIEKHVSTVMALLLTELGSVDHELASGYALHNALSCFAAEELQHADMFYRYVRLLLGRDFKLADNRMAARLALYQGDDSVFVKLGALVAGAYVGESVMTVFEHRIDRMDPQTRFFVSQVVKLHGLDEARHIQFDHFVFEHVIARYSPSETRRFGQILQGQLELNRALGIDFEQLAHSVIGCDYLTGNVAHATQQRLLEVFAKLVFASGRARRIDDVLDDGVQRVLSEFAGTSQIHPIARPVPAATSSP